MAKSKDTVLLQNAVHFQKKGIVISREYGRHENGNKFKGQWVARDSDSGEYLDNSIILDELFSKFGFSYSDFGGAKDPFQEAVKEHLRTAMKTENYRFKLPMQSGRLEIRYDVSTWCLGGGFGSQRVPLISVTFFERMGENNYESVQPQYFHCDDLEEAIECFMTRGTSLTPSRAVPHKRCDNLEGIYVRNMMNKSSIPTREDLTIRVEMKDLKDTGDFFEVLSAKVKEIDAKFPGLFKPIQMIASVMSGWSDPILEQVRDKVLVIVCKENPHMYWETNKKVNIPVLSLINTEELHKDARGVAALDLSLWDRQTISSKDKKTLIEKIKPVVEIVLQDKDKFEYSVDNVLGIFTPEFQDEIFNDKNRLKKHFLLIFGETQVRFAWGDDLPYTFV